MAEVSSGMVLAAVAGALLVVAVPGAWVWARSVMTLVHEAGHTLVALGCGRKVHAIKLFHTGGGCTTHSGVGGFAAALTTAAGYPAPPLVGLALAAAVAHQTPARYLLIGAIPIVLLLLWFTRNPFGALVSGLVLAALVLLLRQSGPSAQALVLFSGSIFLLLGGLRSTIDLFTLVRAGSRSNDAAMLARMTGVPATLWALSYIAVALACLYFSASWLIPVITTSA